MSRLINVLEWIPKIFGLIAGWLTVALILVITYDVGSRKIPGLHGYISNSFLYDFISPTKLQELEWHLLAAIFLFSLGWAYLKNIHVRVDIIREDLDHKTKEKLELAGLIVLGLPYFMTMLYFSWDYVLTSYLQGEGSSSMTGIPHRWVIKSALLVGFFGLVMSMIATILKLTCSIWSSHGAEKNKIVEKPLGATKPN